MTLLFIANTLWLTLSSLWIIQRTTTVASRSEILSYAFMLIWANIVITANILSLASKLISAEFFTLVSFVLNVSLVLAIFLLCRKEPGRPPLVSLFLRPFNIGRKNKILAILFLAFLAMFWICVNYVPFIPDTLALKLSKIHFYLQSGQLLPSKDVDFEIMWLNPVNGAIAWLYFIIYRLGLNSILLFSLLNWTILGTATYALSRKLGATKRASLFATAILLLSETVILAGTADSDDIIAATPFAVGLLALVQWLKKPNYFFALLTGIGFGLSFGNKPFLVFFYPVAIFLLIGLPIKYGVIESIMWPFKQWRHIVLAGSLAATMAFGVFYENYSVRKNPLAFPSLFASHRNQALDGKTFGINLVSQNFNLFITPVASWFADITRTRAHTTAWTNGKAAELIEKIFKVDQDQVNKKYSAHFNKTTVMDELYYDHSVQFGFLPHLAILSMIFLLFGPRKGSYLPAVGLASAFLIWDITYCLHYKYIAGIMRYWIIVFVPVVPAVALAWDKVRSSKKTAFSQILHVLFVGIFLLTAIAAARGLTKNYYRSLGAIFDGRNRNEYTDLFSPELRALMVQLPAFQVIAYYTNPLFLFLHQNQDASVKYKYVLSPDIPNIVTSMDGTPLMENHPFVEYRLLPIATTIQDDRLFSNMGNCPNGTCFVNNISNQAGAGKRVFLFAISQPEANKVAPMVSITPWNGSFPIADWEMQVSEADAAGQRTILAQWSPVRPRQVTLARKRKSILIELRETNSKDTFFGSYRYYKSAQTAVIPESRQQD